MMKNKESPKRGLCDVIEDVYHILVECERNDYFRFSFDVSTM